MYKHEIGMGNCAGSLTNPIVINKLRGTKQAWTTTAQPNTEIGELFYIKKINLAKMRKKNFKRVLAQNNGFD